MELFDPALYDYLVALDLGSDSMAACWGRPDIPGLPAMIPLQEYADSLHPSSGDAAFVLRDEEGQPSCRMESKVQFRRLEYKFEDEEGRIVFVKPDGKIDLDKYQETCFLLFRKFDAAPNHRELLPNPKLFFQYNANLALDLDGRQLEAEKTLTHLAAQIIQNLVLRSSPLRGVDLKRVMVVLTVPNVYSVTHAQRLTQKIRELVDVGRVEWLSESDAIAFFWSRYGAQHQFAENLDPNLEHRRYITIDVGKGTTDLSVLHTQSPPSGRAPKTVILGRAGTSSGGSELTFLFARFFDEEIRRVFAVVGSKMQYARPPVSFLGMAQDGRTSSRQRGEVFNRLLNQLEKLCNVTKAACSDSLHIEVPESKETERLVQSIADGLTRYVYEDLPDEERGDLEPLRRLRNAIAEALFFGDVRLASDLTLAPAPEAERKGWNLWSRRKAKPLPPMDAPVVRESKLSLKAWQPPESVEDQDTLRVLPEEGSPRTRPFSEGELRVVMLSRRDRLGQLGKDISDYVERNADRLIHDLARMVSTNQSNDTNFPVSDAQQLGGTPQASVDALVVPRATTVIVAGQASQFRPLYSRLRSLFAVHEARGDVAWRFLQDLAHIEEIGSEALKTACCRGAYGYFTAGHRIVNREALFGSYFLAPANADTPLPDGRRRYSLNLRLLNVSGDSHPGIGVVSTAYDFCFSTRVVKDTQPLREEEISRIKWIPIQEAPLGPAGTSVQLPIKYFRDPADGCRKFVIGTAVVDTVAFGNLPGAIWDKVWPERLRRG
ncbi:hypothetical protein [Fimbriimonas ginsengisoli]|uniref:Uncharacterized protein n=1 Tax=Fimbriimonas ginsengisoli Gsoil 348 TaxID=661478 RepID=A0A068NTE6_FIMGI|nr:hypothetical protein [Fimbriimonas ginsengisoli]AIE86030.1 hypothetical protein OP10G_2662 [Fimbriimonas ginsengisoli Gsoil 348]